MLDPQIASAIATMMSFGTKLNVCSLIDVAACTIPKTTPAISAGIRMGADPSANIQSARCATSMKKS